MRFLFVYQDFSVRAKGLLESLRVRDVTLIIARKNALEPSPDELSLLQNYHKAPAAACQVNRKYRKNIASLVTLQYEAKAFRDDDQQLREWLLPADHGSVINNDKPSEAFQKAACREPRLVIASRALESADQLAEHRWDFARQGAELLERYAKGEELGPLRDWKNRHGINFAGNGKVRFKYKTPKGRTEITEWHLKAGDNTTRESAARIYFGRIELDHGHCIVVFYCGPHPDDGMYSVDIDIQQQSFDIAS